MEPSRGFTRLGEMNDTLTRDPGLFIGPGHVCKAMHVEQQCNLQLEGLYKKTLVYLVHILVVTLHFA